MNIKYFTSLILVISLTANLFAQNDKKLTKEELAASKTIEFINRVIDLNNSYTSQWNNIELLLENGEELIHSTINDQVDNSSIIQFQPIENDKKLIDQYRATLKSTPDFEGKNEIENKVSLALIEIENLNSLAKQYADYFNKGEFSKETSTRNNHKTLSDKLWNQYESTVATWKDISTQAVVTGESAEISILKNNPEGVFIIPMKIVLMDLRLMRASFYSINKSDAPDYSPLLNEINEFYSNVDKYKNMSGKNLSIISNKTSYYLNFFEQAEECASSIEVLTKSMINEHENEQLIDGYESDMNEKCNNMNDLYNQVINTLF